MQLGVLRATMKLVVLRDRSNGAPVKHLAVGAQSNALVRAANHIDNVRANEPRNRLERWRRTAIAGRNRSARASRLSNAELNASF